MTKAEQDVLSERARQREKYGATDGDYQPGTLATAGAHLACPIGVASQALIQFDAMWAMRCGGKYQNNRRLELVVSAALILAEIEKMDGVQIGIDKASDGPEVEIKDALVFGGKVYRDLALPSGMIPTVALIADLPAQTDRMFLNETWLSGRERKGMIRVVACAPLGESAPYVLPLPLSEPDMAALEATLCDGESCTARFVVGWMPQADYDALSEFDGW